MTIAKIPFLALVSAMLSVSVASAQSSGGSNTSGSTSGSSGSSSSGSNTPTCTSSAPSQLVSLHIPNESAPPGGMVQMKLMVTEPTPITHGSTKLTKPTSATTSGIHLFSPGGDAYGVAIESSSALSLAYTTSVGAQGSDYPIMTLAFQLSPNLTVGSSQQFNLDPSSTWSLGPLGLATMKPIVPATITVGGSISITNVVPGGGLLPAGTVVNIQGIGFQSGTQVQLSNVSVSSIQVVDAQNIQIVLATDTDMTGKKIQVVNPDGSQDTYFSYLRGVAFGSSNRSLLTTALPVFSSVARSQASFAAGTFAKASQFSGTAVQNQNLSPVAVTFTLFSSTNDPLGTSTIVLPSGTYLVRETSELAQGISPPPGSYISVTASQPIEVFGFLADDSAGTVVPMPYLSPAQ